MATSSSFNLVATRDDIIETALGHIGALEPNVEAGTNELTDASRVLNYMVKNWQARGINIWATERVYVFLQKDTSEYSLGSASGDWHSTTEDPINGYTTTIADAAKSATDIEVESSSGMTTGDTILLETDNNDLHADTIASVVDSENITITTGLDFAMESGLYVYHYTNKAERPMQILSASVVQAPSTDSDSRVLSDEFPVHLMTRKEYHELTTKTADGQVTQLFYQPTIGTSPNPGSGTLFVWPQTDDVTDYLKLWVQRTLADFDAASDNPDFPQEWYDPLTWNLALRLCPGYGVSSEVYNMVKEMAITTLLDAEGFDSEDGFDVQPDNELNVGST